jgi:hypothetical protein
MEATELNEQLCTAITRRSLVMFEYGDLIRVVEPHRVGVNSAGRLMLSGWLRAGYSRSDPSGGWRNYLLRDISSFQRLDAPFAGARPGYAAHDPRMRETFAELPAATTDVPSRGPFIVHDAAAPGAMPAPLADTAPKAHPAEGARTQDGEIDMPEAHP